ncbi:hypothetical protein [Burkholderia pseudomallei]|uniref:hypothetical protein n=1 Tax=Burkholderia pseudomallei TaxID=28450 RepID=UPI0016050E76|nr:hypothetical protein [Burkholderia pseudomallei]
MILREAQLATSAFLSLEMDELLKSVYEENFPSLFSSGLSKGGQRDLVKALTV